MANRLQKKNITPKELLIDESLKDFSKKESSKKKTTETIPPQSTLNDDRTQKLVGIICILIAFLLCAAFTSYLFTWKIDADRVAQQGFKFLFTENIPAENILGRWGAYISNLLMFKGFGIGAYFLCILFFVSGIRPLSKEKKGSLTKKNLFYLFGMLYTSVVLGFLFQKIEFPMGGLSGLYTADVIQNAVGGLGSVLAYGFIGLLIAIFKFNASLNFQLPKLFHKKKNEELPSLEEMPIVENKLEDISIEEDIFELPQETGNVFHPTENFKNPFRDKNAKATLPDDELLKLEIIEKELKEELNEDDLIPITPIVTPIPVTTPTSLVINPISEEQIIEEESPVQKKNIVEPIILPPMEVVEKISTEDETALEEKSEIDNEDEDSDPYLYLKDYKYPTTPLLQDYGDDKIVLDTTELESNKNQIIETLKNYSIDIQRISATIGPTVTLYEIVPAAGVRISKIKNLEDDIALSLSALGIRIIAPIPGKGTIGIEVPNTKKRIVSMKTLLKSDKFKNSNYALPIALGKKIDNENFIVDLASMPHLLMAGATGQGKSVGINAVLISLLFKKHPSQLKFVLIDPKKVELTLYRTIENHFLAKLPGEAEAIITDTKKVIHTLNSLCIEMDMRYDLLKDAACRNIREYNEKYADHKLDKSKGHQFLPFIVLVIDEFADLIMTAGKEVETPIARLAQLARAIGIHLIIATQRPSVNIITGIIKANFPARVAFRVSSKIDSRTILDTGGADQLIGKGDMLISYNGDLVRLQCAFVDTPEVERVCEFIGQQKAYPHPFLLPEFTGDDENVEKDIGDMGDKDPLFEEAARLIVQAQVGSTSYLQRRMKLGFNRAGRIMDQLETAGIVGGASGSKPREVLVKTLAELENRI